MTLGTTALVTGAARGLGRSIAEHLAGHGASVAVLGRTAESLEPVLAAIRATGARGIAVVADVTDLSAVTAAVADAEAALGPLDLVVNNAGLIDDAEVPFWETDPDRWWAVVETNLRGPANVDRAVIPGMLARGRGRIVNINSGFALRTDPNYSAYSTSKAALLRLSDAMAGPLAERGVYLFDVSPGAVATDMTAGMAMFEGKSDWYDKQRILGAVTAVAEGKVDALAGRFLHAGKDDIVKLAAERADDIAERDARRLHLRPYGDDDPEG